MSEVRLWEPADEVDDVQIEVDVARAGPLGPQDVLDSKSLIGYWPLVPDPDADTQQLVERVSQYKAGKEDRSGQRYGADWRVLPPRSGLTLQFDGVNDAAWVPDLVLPTDDWLLANASEGSLPEPYAVTFAAWVYVDELPSRAKWIVGEVGSELSALAPSRPVTVTVDEVAAAQAAREAAQAELRDAMEAALQVDTTVERALAARGQARDRLIIALEKLSVLGETAAGLGLAAATGGLSTPALDARSGPIAGAGPDDPANLVIELAEEELNLAELKSQPTKEVAVEESIALAIKAVEDTKERMSSAVAQYQEAWNSMRSEPSESTVAAAALAGQQSYLAKLNHTIAYYDLWQQAVAAELVSLDPTILGKARFQGFTAPSEVHKKLTEFRERLVHQPAYLLLARLSDLIEAENELDRVWNQSDLDGADLLGEVQRAEDRVTAAQASWDETLAKLEPALQQQRDENLKVLAAPSSLRYRARSGDTLASVAARYWSSEPALAAANGITNPPSSLPVGMVLTIPVSAEFRQNTSATDDALLAIAELHAAEADLAYARAPGEAVTEARTRLHDAEDRLEKARQQQQEIQATQDRLEAPKQAVNEARQALADAPPGEVQAAREHLAEAEANLRAARQGFAKDLSDLMQRTQDDEAKLQDLDEQLQAALRDSLDEGLKAAQQYELERWIDALLAFFLGTSPPAKTKWETVSSAALMAARGHLKADADLRVDQARAKLEAAEAKRNALGTAQGSPTVRQTIIDNLTKMLNSLNGEVKTAEDELKKAIEDQQQAQEQADIPTDLAEALSQAVAEVVTEQVLGLPPATVGRLIATPSEQDKLWADMQVEIDAAMDRAVRRPREQLSAWSSYLDQQLDAELQAGAGSRIERDAKQEARIRLQTLVKELTTLLSNSQEPPAPLGTTLDELLPRVGETAEADRLKRMREAYEQARANAKAALDLLIQTEQSASDLSSRRDGTRGASAPTASPTPAPGIGEDRGTPTVMPTPGAGQGKETPTVMPTPGAGQGKEGPTVTPAPTSPPASAPTGETLPATNWWGALIVDRRGYAAVVVQQGLAGTWLELSDRKSLPTQRWVHYTGVITFDGGDTPQLALYRDGLDVRNDPALPAGDRVDLEPGRCAAGVYVGGLCKTAQGSFFKGRIDDIRIWERALGEDEMRRWIERPGEFYDEVAYWPLDDGPGSQVVRKGCRVDQSCNLSRDLYPLPVSGPSWVNADLRLLDFAVVVDAQ